MKHCYRKLLDNLSRILFGNGKVTQAQWKQVINLLRAAGAGIGYLGVTEYKSGRYLFSLGYFLLGLAITWLALRVSSNVRDKE